MPPDSALWDYNILGGATYQIVLGLNWGVSGANMDLWFN